jgi:TRAP-type mannitol/chloroaromatic compound transport system substrate-binding protein
MKRKVPLAVFTPLAAVAAISLLATDAGLSRAEAQAVIDGPTVNWRFSTWGKQRAFTLGAEHLAKRLSERTGGKFTMRVFYGEALSKDRENLDGLKINAFEGAHFCNFYHPGKNPAFMVFSLPFLPIGDWAVSAYTRPKLFEHPALVADMERWNAIAYAATLLPQYEFLGRGNPPLKLEDWKGLRVRAGGGIGDAMARLGAVRSTVTATEVYTAIERGTLDAASFPYTYAHISYRIHEITNWFTSNMSPGTAECPLVLNKTAYEKLPEQYRKLLDELRQEITDVHIQAYKDADTKNMPLLEKRLKKIVYTPEQLEEFQRVAGQPVWDQWVNDNKDKFDAKGVLDRLFSLAGEAQKKATN